jgi:phosphoserine aminotransferase
MAQHNRRVTVARNEHALNFARSSAPACGAAALDLVYQAAEVLGSIENHARETEARAQAMCESAAERLQHAKQQIETAERSRREIIADAGAKLQDASRALTDAERRIVAAEDKATAAEVRACIAETEAHEAKQALALVEEAIRRRLLCASPETIGELNAVA